MGIVKKGRLVAAGVTKSTKKAPMVDPRGAYTKVQQRTLGKMQKGGKIDRLQKREEALVYRGNKAVDEGRYKKADRLLGRAARVEDRKIRASKAKDGKWIQKATASIKRRGTEGKCTPITKPGCTGRAKALAKTFKKMAKARKGK